MKNYLMFALILCAIPAVAVGQTVTCDECTHVASVYMGEGGVIATADDADMVTWVASCGGVTRSGELMANDDGMVAALWAGDLACMAQGGGSFEIGPVMDGGWFWVTDDMNSAVGGLVSKMVLKNEMADITSAGDGVSMMEGKGAVYLKEAATGRVGILPTILPEPPMPELAKCGANDRGSTGRSATVGATASNAQFTVRNRACALGDGKMKVLATTTNTFTGAVTEVMSGGTIVRPSGSGSVVVTIDLWGNGSGHYTTVPGSASAFNADGDPVPAQARGHALLGNPAIAMTGLRSALRLQGVTYRGNLGDGPLGSSLVEDTASAGITMDGSDSGDVLTVSIGRNTSYCNTTPPANTPVKVTVTALVATPADATQVTPSLALARDTATTGNPVQLAGTTSFTVICGGASSSAHQGQELVPENPFPVSE